jgi:hypothetical protein
MFFFCNNLQNTFNCYLMVLQTVKFKADVPIQFLLLNDFEEG